MVNDDAPSDDSPRDGSETSLEDLAEPTEALTHPAEDGASAADASSSTECETAPRSAEAAVAESSSDGEAALTERSMGGAGTDDDARAGRRITAERVVIAVLLVVGIVVRLLGNVGDPIGLTGDEAVWAKKLLTESLTDLSIRPLGYMWLVKQTVELGGLSELTLRLPSLIAGLGVLLLTPYIASRILRSPWTRVLATLIVATHPALVDFAKEFKPYAWEGFIHLLLVAGVLRYRAKPSRWLAVVLFVTPPLLFPLAYNIVFAFPGLYLLFFADAVKQRRWRVVGGVVVSAAVALAAIGGIYKTALTTATSKKSSDFWGDKYGVFYSASKVGRLDDILEPEDSQLLWTVEKYAQIAAFPGKVRAVTDFYPDPKARSVISRRAALELRAGDVILWSVLHVAGLIALLRRRRFDALAMLWLPLVVLTVFGMAAVWPFGPFRTNTFLIAHTALLGLVALDEPLAAAGGWPRRFGELGLVLVGVFTLLPQVLFDPHPYVAKRWWTTNFYPSEVAAAVVSHETRLGLRDKKGRRVLIYEPLGYPLKFYANFMPAFQARHGEDFTPHVRMVWASRANRTVGRYLRRGPVWVLFSRAQYLDSKTKGIESAFTVLAKERIRDQHVLLLVERKSRPRPKPAPVKKSVKKTPPRPAKKPPVRPTASSLPSSVRPRPSSSN